jgi:hypothetical protein
LVDHEVDRIVKLRAIAGLRAENCIAKSISISCKFRQNPDVIVKRYNHDLIIGPQLVYEGNRCVLNVLDSEASRTAGIDHQYHRERLINRGKKRYVLFDTILPQAKVLFGQIRYVPAIAVGNANRKRYQSGVNANDVA